MASVWAVRKQLTYFLVFIIVVLAGLYFVWWGVTKPTCFDNKQNGNEEGLDCGGPCAKKCLGEVQDLIVLWSKFFEISPGKYDAAALIKNPNIFLALPSVKYYFKAYDKDNILIIEKQGEATITPGETFPVFLTGLDIGSRIPSKVFLTFENNPNWERVEKQRPSLVVVQKEFSNTLPFPRLSVTLKNKSSFESSNIEVAAVFYDKDNNAFGVSLTKIDAIPGNGSQKAVFTWPELFSEEPASIEIFFRQSL